MSTPERPIDASLDLEAELDKRDEGWGVEITQDGDVRQGDNPTIGSMPHPHSRNVELVGDHEFGEGE
jgi:hypothetical protein